jgi:hypothetical protein
LTVGLVDPWTAASFVPLEGDAERLKKAFMPSRIGCGPCFPVFTRRRALKGDQSVGDSIDDKEVVNKKR